MKLAKYAITFTGVLALLAAMPALNTPHAFASPAIQEAADQNDSQIQSALIKELSRSRFKDVHVSVSKGVVDLTGSVELFAYKEEAEKKAHRTKDTVAVRNLIHVAGTRMSDQDLQTKLVQKLEFDRVGYGTTAFNAISVNVRDGVVRLGGHAYGPTDKSSALSVISYTPGVQDVIDEIEVDPVSPMDDRIRLNVARLIYGYPSLMKYSIDPGRPIRISVQNGHVTLYGVVDTASDKDTAYIRANGAQGVFKVTNELQVEGARSERD
jgi:osmotically-inducible protein OsmY